MNIALSNIDDCLDLILPLLWELWNRDQPDWHPVTAIKNCQSGKWMLFTSDDTGFAMASVREQADGQRSLFIEVACHPASSLTVDDYQPFWDKLARDLGCSEICMSSKRIGWQRKGWKMGWIQYSRPVKGV